MLTDVMCAVNINEEKKGTDLQREATSRFYISYLNSIVTVVETIGQL